MIDAGFWRGRRVLVTGHTGFKGSWLTLWLHALGAEVVECYEAYRDGRGLRAVTIAQIEAFGQ